MKRNACYLRAEGIVRTKFFETVRVGNPPSGDLNPGSISKNVGAQHVQCRIIKIIFFEDIDLRLFVILPYVDFCLNKTQPIILLKSCYHILG